MDLSSPTRDGTRAACVGSVESTTEPPGKSLSGIILKRQRTNILSQSNKNTQNLQPDELPYKGFSEKKKDIGQKL